MPDAPATSMVASSAATFGANVYAMNFHNEIASTGEDMVSSHGLGRKDCAAVYKFLAPSQDEAPV